MIWSYFRVYCCQNTVYRSHSLESVETFLSKRRNSQIPRLLSPYLQPLPHTRVNDNSSRRVFTNDFIIKKPHTYTHTYTTLRILCLSRPAGQRNVTYVVEFSHRENARTHARMHGRRGSRARWKRPPTPSFPLRGAVDAFSPDSCAPSTTWQRLSPPPLLGGEISFAERRLRATHGATPWTEFGAATAEATLGARLTPPRGRRGDGGRRGRAEDAARGASAGTATWKLPRRLAPTGYHRCLSIRISR